MNSKPLLLVVDDETTILQTLKEALEDEQYRVETLEEGFKTLDLIGKLIPDLVFLDIFMPNINGLKLLEDIKKEYPQQKVMIISGFGNIPIAIEAIRKGALDFIEKPFNLDEILSKISFLKTEENSEVCKNIVEELPKEKLQNYGIVGQSYLFLELMQQIAQIVPLKFPLLIYGQDGTGKTLLAKYVHQKNHQNLENFFEINCFDNFVSNNMNQAEELFKISSGTLFFKHVDKLNLENQKKLLLLLENYKDKTIRIITSSCIPLFNLTQTGKFDSLLFNKLNITPIEIPSLNKRRYDIPLLVTHFLQEFNKKYGKSVAINTKGFRTLRNHDWQGNVSELKNLINRVVYSAPYSTVITSEYLTNFLCEKKSQFVEEQSFLRFSSLKEAINEFEKNFLLYLLKKHKYDLKQVCDRLSLTTVQLRDKMFKFDIEKYVKN